MKAFKCRFETTFDVNTLMEVVKENNLLFLIRQLITEENGMDVYVQFLVVEVDENTGIKTSIPRSKLIEIMGSIDDMHVPIRTLEEFFIT